MKTVLWVVAGVCSGLFVAFALVVAVELFSAVVHPLPEGFGGTQEEMCRHVERYPAWVLAVVVPLWGLTAFAAAWTAQRVGGLPASVIIGVLLMAALGLNVSMLPYPLWFEIACLLAITASVVVGGRASRRPKTAETVAAG